MADARIYADLKADHDRHRALLRDIDGASGDERAALFETFRIEVSAHAAAEEEALYSMMLANPDLRDEARHSVSEHKEIDDFLGQIAALDVTGDEWSERFAAMRHRYEHHIDEEEEEMFPAAAEELSDAEEARIAAVFEDRKPKERAIAEATPPGDDRD